MYINIYTEKGLNEKQWQRGRMIRKSNDMGKIIEAVSVRGLRTFKRD